MIYDLLPFSGEYDLLEIRFNILSPIVDKFIIVEGVETFSGNTKILYWIERDRERFEEWEGKVEYCLVSDYTNPEINEQIKAREDYVNAPPFQRAFYQKEMLRKTLEKLNPNDEDLVYYGDADEIWKPKEIDDQVYKLRQLAYSYFLNNRSQEDWRGTIVTKWKNLKNGCLNDMRANPVNILEDGGWHFTNLGGLEAIKRKIESYDHQEVNVDWVKNGLGEKIELNVDFLGRGYKMWKDDSQLPHFILENKERYNICGNEESKIITTLFRQKHLCYLPP